MVFHQRSPQAWPNSGGSECGDTVTLFSTCTRRLGDRSQSKSHSEAPLSFLQRLESIDHRHDGDRDGIADCLLEHRQYDACAGGPASKRDWSAVVPGGEPQPSGPAVVDREFITGRPGWRRGDTPGLVEPQGIPDVSFALPGAECRRDNTLPRSGRAGFDFYVLSFAPRRDGIRSPPCPARNANRPGIHAQRRWSSLRRPPGALTAAQWAGGGTGGALAGPADHLWAAPARGHLVISNRPRL